MNRAGKRIHGVNPDLHFEVWKGTWQFSSISANVCRIPEKAKLVSSETHRIAFMCYFTYIKTVQNQLQNYLSCSRFLYVLITLEFFN